MVSSQEGANQDLQNNVEGRLDCAEPPGRVNQYGLMSQLRQSQEEAGPELDLEGGDPEENQGKRNYAKGWTERIQHGMSSGK